MKRLLVRALLTLALIPGASACDATAPRSLVGVFALETVGGAALPYVLEETPVRLDLIAERYTIYDDGSYELESTVHNGTAPRTDVSAGRYSLSGTQFTFQPGEIAPGVGIPGREGTLTSSALTLTTGGWGEPVIVWVYRKVDS